MKALIFDMDGVIIESEHFHEKAMQQVFDYYGVEMTKEERLASVGIPEHENYQRIVSRYNLNVDPMEMVKLKDEYYLPYLRSDVELVAGFDELLSYILTMNFPMAIASSSQRERIDLVRDRFDLHEAFQATVAGDEVSRGKPDPEIYLTAASKLGVEAGDCMVIEDAHAGVLSAKAAGMQCIGYLNVHTQPQDLSKADKQVNSLAEALEYFKQR